MTAGDFDFIYKVVYGEYEEGSCGVYCVHDGDGKIEKTLREDESVHTEEYVPNCHVFDWLWRYVLVFACEGDGEIEEKETECPAEIGRERIDAMLADVEKAKHPNETGDAPAEIGGAILSDEWYRFIKKDLHFSVIIILINSCFLKNINLWTF